MRQAVPVTPARSALLAALGTATAVQAARWTRVARSILTYRDYWAERAERQGELCYVALGDSLAQGVGASDPELGYVGLVARDLAARTGRRVRVVNLSVTGVRLAGVVGGQLPMLADLSPDLVTVAVGANDAGRTAPDAFGEQFARLCRALPDGALVADIPDFQSGPRRGAAAALSAIARSVVAARPMLTLVPLEAATAHLRLRDYSADLFHPSDAGYRRYANAFIGALRVREFDGLAVVNDDRRGGW